MERQGETALADQRAPIPLSPFRDTHPPTPNPQPHSQDPRSTRQQLT